MAGTEYTLPRAELSKPAKLLIAVAPFYRDIADNMIKGAVAEIEATGATYDLVEVPGALELPTAIGIAERLSNFDGYVALGCVIRGETTHYETVCNDSSRGITLLGLQGLCIGNGILTVENREQAQLRADPARMNKGAGAAAAALHLIALTRKWGAPRKGVGFIPGADEMQIAGKSKDTPTA
ncbi:6,7-dimethyl-8-ribityllumazine synthase [Roseovarius nanhaiticus]|uniref:6,7-dimethyl-8-ribityllumazine synthase n=1 Tax=Roseovarius nanhaiticus TaxID=573024 RepID=UPI0024932F02|nr:6,7-dimethyl-8-ribityllumazine synthase [Roseovarius nanhaiticus]